MKKLPPFSQLSKLMLLLMFVLSTPFIPTSLRHPYLYFLFNILVVTLGIESGLLKAIASPQEEKKHSLTYQVGPNVVAPQTFHPCVYNGVNVMMKTKSIASIATQALAKPIEKAKVETSKLSGIIPVNKIKKCASKPSLFFIGGLESEHEHKNEIIKKEEKEEQKELEKVQMDAEAMTKQELFTKAENFIGNFYKQLKMQREQSWKKIHGLLS